MKKQSNGPKDRERLGREFRTRQTRQIIAIAAALFLILLSAVVYKRPDIFGELPKSTLFGAQAVVIAAFIGFAYVNWRCPSCSKYLGSDIHKRFCKKCGAILS